MSKWLQAALGKCRLDIGKKLFMERVVKRWNKFIAFGWEKVKFLHSS